MIEIENIKVVGWEAALRGMRNPMNSWEKSDSLFTVPNEDGVYIGANDKALAQKLADAGAVHAKYRRMIVVYVDVTAPLYWWKHYSTYQVGTVSNSCSTMHKIHEKEFTEEDFSCEHLHMLVDDYGNNINFMTTLRQTIAALNVARRMYVETKEKVWWWQMIQLLPSSYNQKRTIMLNYEVLANIYKWRRNHKLDEWQVFCDWIETLPYSELITGVRE